MNRNYNHGDIMANDDDVILLSEITRYLEMQHNYNAAIKEVRTKLEILSDEFAAKHDHNPIHNIESRLKSPHSIVKKLRKRSLNVSVPSARENLHDIAGVRVICCYIDDIYTIANLLTSQNDITLIQIKDYIKDPKPNGYRSLHLVLSIPIFLSEGPVDIPVEIQIRTVAMDVWASLEHELRYKTKNSIPDTANDELCACASMLSDLDLRMQNLFRQAIGKPEND
ncbi:MAG: GTP pyrophosphokinase family protein [Clostridia bacterium]|nr:GTP pyrophosphokinase family protein [Clostridia bacterium]